MENHHFQWENPLYMVILNSYVCLPEGMLTIPKWVVYGIVLSTLLQFGSPLFAILPRRSNTSANPSGELCITGHGSQTLEGFDAETAVEDTHLPAKICRYPAGIPWLYFKIAIENHGLIFWGLMG